MVRDENHMTTPYAKMLCLGMGMLFLGKQERVEATIEARIPLLFLLLSTTAADFQDVQ